MNNKTINGMKYILYLFGSLMVALPVQAASFDCANAGTKVEKLICGDAGLSKLDEQLTEVYNRVSIDNQNVEQLKDQQRKWLKERNQCTDINCLREHYLQRISEIDSYKLIMSKDDNLCNHMLQLFNDDLMKFDRASVQHEEFKSIPWKPARYSFEHGGQVEYRNVEGALFDFNNDGVLDFVVRDKSSLSGMRADFLAMLDASQSKRANDLTFKELRGGKDVIGIAWSFGYPLLPKFEGNENALWLLSPFRYRDTSFLFMQSLYMGKVPTEDFAVIAKYKSGKFLDRDMSGKMEDICYIKRIGVNSNK